jgi:hypothetical protein
MVRRLIPLLEQEDCRSNFLEEDHRYVDPFGWHRPGQDNLSPGSARSGRQGAGEEEVHTAPVADIHREPADFADWLRSLFRSALSGRSIAAARPRCAADRSSVREALCKVEQERLRGRGSNCRGGRTQEHALCPDQDGRPAGPPGDPPSARPAYLAAHGSHQPNSPVRCDIS